MADDCHASKSQRPQKVKLAFNYKLLCPNDDAHGPEYSFEEVRAMSYYKMYEARDAIKREKDAEICMKNREIEALKAQKDREIEELRRQLAESQKQPRIVKEQSSASTLKTRNSSTGTFWNTLNDDFTNVSAFTVGFTTFKSKREDDENNGESTSDVTSKQAKYDFNSTRNMTRDVNRDIQDIFAKNNNTTISGTLSDENTMPIGEAACPIYIDSNLSKKPALLEDDIDIQDTTMRTADLKTFKQCKSLSSRLPLQPIEVTSSSVAAVTTAVLPLEESDETTSRFNPNAMSTISFKPFAQQLATGMNFNESEMNSLESSSNTSTKKSILVKINDDKLTKIIEEDCHTEFGWTRLNSNEASCSQSNITKPKPALSQSMSYYTQKSHDDYQWDDYDDPLRQQQVLQQSTINDSVINKTFAFNTPAKSVLPHLQDTYVATSIESIQINEKLKPVDVYHIIPEISITNTSFTNTADRVISNCAPANETGHIVREKSYLSLSQSIQNQTFNLNTDKTLAMPRGPATPGLIKTPFVERTTLHDDTTVIDICEDNSESEEAREKRDENDEDEDRHDGGELLTMEKFNQTMQENIRVLSILDPNATSHTFDLKTLGFATKNHHTTTKLNINSMSNLMTNEDSNDAPLTTTATLAELNQTLMNAISDPFNDENRKRLLKKRQAYMEAKETYRSLSIAKPIVAPAERLTLCGTHYKVIKKIGTGAYADIYLLEKRNKDKTVSKLALKVSCQSSAWEYYITEVLHERIQELKTQMIINSSYVKFKDFCIYDDGSFSAMQYYHNGTLLDLINYHVEKKETFPYWLVIYLTTELLTIISYLHKCRIIHGDIKPDNLMIDLLPNSLSYFDRKRTKCLVLIDFNRSIDLDMFPEETKFDAKASNKSLLCCEMIENKPWTFQIDYYGILACIHCIIHKKYMKVYNEQGHNKAISSFPRHFDKLFDQLFATYLNITSCEEMPNLEGEWLPKFCNLFKEEIKNFKKSEKYLSDLAANFSGDFKLGKNSL